MKNRINIVSSHLLRSIMMILMMGWMGSVWAIDNFEIDLTKNPIGTLPEGVTQISYSQHGVSFNGSQHGWCWYAIEFQVDGPVKITLGGCQYTNSGYEGYLYVNGQAPSDGGAIKNKTEKCWHENKDQYVGTYIYKGEAATLQVYCGEYCPYLKVEKYEVSTPNVPVAEGLYDKVVKNAAELKAALSAANGSADKRYKIFVTNGTYHLGTDYDTQVKNYTSIIGESRDGVVIENHPATEGIWNSATLRPQSNVILQNLTLRCTVDYDSSAGAERGTALYDEGSNNIYKNIRLLGRQDTYYSSDNTNSYFENCEIHGTVDFICGSGNVWFEKCTIIGEQSNNVYIVAPRTMGEQKGYFFNQCKIQKAEGANIPNFYLGRGWSKKPKTVFANCTMDGEYDYNKNSWADGANHDSSDADGMTTQATALSNASSTMGDVATSAQPIAAPTTVTLTENTLSWSAVENASGYAVFRDGSLISLVGKDVLSLDISSYHSTKQFAVASIAADGAIGIQKTTQAEDSFVDFKIDFRADPYSVTLPSDGQLPQGVTVTKGGYNGPQHGATNTNITVKVDGAVKFTIGGCQYTNQATVTINGETAVIDTKSPGCDNSGVGNGYTHYATYIYNSEEPATLVFDLGNYCPYFFAEKCEYTPDVTVSYYNTDNSLIGTETVAAGSELTYQYHEANVTVPAGSKFRGWFDSTQENAKKVAEGTALNKDLNLYAKATPEEVIECGANFKYNLTKDYFYPEDHEGIEIVNGSFHDGQHGWYFDNNASINLPVAGKAKIVLSLCQYGSAGTIQVVDANGKKVGEDINVPVNKDGNTATINYTGNATTLTLKMPANSYLHQLEVINEGAVTIQFADTRDKATIYNNNMGMVYYTLDGSTPTTESTHHFSSESLVVPISANTWIKAISVKNGVSSQVVATYCRTTFTSFKLDLSSQTNPLLGNEGKKQGEKVSTGVVVDDKQQIHLVSKDDPSASISLDATWNGLHGYYNMTADIPVDGPVNIYIGNCFYNSKGDDNKYGTIKITNDLNDKEISFVPSVANCYHLNKKNNFTKVRYEGEATVLHLKYENNVYIPFIAVLDDNYPVVTFVNKYPTTLQGSVPPVMEPTNGIVHIPENNSLYRDGWVITGWTDGDSFYPIGEDAHIDKSTTLYPVMEKSEYDMTDTNQPVSVTWPFDCSEAPAMSLHNNASDPLDFTYTQQVWVNKDEAGSNSSKVTLNKMVAVPLYIDAKDGKVDNTDERTNNLGSGVGNEPVKGGQINDNVLLTLPAVYGMTVTLNASDKVDNKYTNNTTNFTGDHAAVIEIYEGDKKIELAPTEKEAKKITYTYQGDATEITLKMVKTGSTQTWGFFKDLTVGYPVLPNVVGKNVIEFKEGESKLPNENPENAGIVTVSGKELKGSHANIGKRFKVGDEVTIYADPNYGYRVTGYRINGENLKTYDKVINQDNQDNPDNNSLDAQDQISVQASKTVLAADYTLTKEGISTIEVLYERLTMYKVVVKSADKALGSVSLSPKYSNFYNEIVSEDGKSIEQIESYYTQDTKVEASAEAIEEYVLEKWTDTDGSQELNTDNVYDFDMPASDKTLIAHFKKGEIGSVVFRIVGDKCVKINEVTPSYNNSYSVKPDDIHNVRSFTIPTNYTFYKNVGENGEATTNSYTLRYWVDANNESNRYELGKSYSFKKENETLTLVPRFEYNPATQNNRLNNPIIRYDFGTQIRDYYDPTSQKWRKVCAQPVNIGKNQKPFWTTEVYVEVLQEGKELPHTRDVTMWCDTGDKGYIRNNDMKGWASFGPGTTFYFASGAGTKISILSYSPITTTTIDGHVPTLDKDRTQTEREKPENAKIKDHIYVYSYTTQNPALRPKIVIGDDYSYYQWIETATLAANLVKLDVTVDDKVHGELNSIEAISGHDAEEQEDGSFAIHQGDRVKLTFEREFGFEFDKIIDQNLLDKEGNPTSILEMLDNDKVKMIDFDYVDKFHEIDKNSDGSWGIGPKDETDAQKTVFVLRKTEPTPEEAAKGKRTKYEVEFDITNHRSLQICYKVKPTYYITYNAGQLATGSAPAAEWVEEGDTYTIPKNTTLYYEGNTLHHWVDEDNVVYQIGSPNKALAKDLRLFPVFTANPFNILDLEGDATATWHFATKDGAPVMSYERSDGILVTQLYKDDTQKEWIDLKLNLDANDVIGPDGKPVMVNNSVVAGKFNNTSYENRIQINKYSVINFPATPNCVAKLTATHDVSSTWIAGKKKGDAEYESGTNYIQVICANDSANNNVVFTENNQWCVDFIVTYKHQDAVKPDLQTLTCEEVTLDKTQIDNMMNSAQKCITFQVSPWKNADEAMPKVTGTATHEGTVSATDATLITKESAVTVRTKGGTIVKTYPVKFEFKEPTEAPEFVKVVVNGKEYTDPTTEIYNVPRSGIIKVIFNRTMAATSLTLDNIEYSANTGKELIFKYWDLPAGGSIQYDIEPGEKIFKDIYGKECQQALKLTLHIMQQQDINLHHTFDFIVGEDGTLDDAIAAANKHQKGDGLRYCIFVPDGEYQLTGNELLTSYSKTSDGYWPCDNNGNPQQDMKGKNNGMTKIEKSNISLIGQSKDGVKIWNKPIVEGIGYTATLHLGQGVNDFYAQDLSLENRFDYWNCIAGQERRGAASGAARGVVLWDQGTRNVMKNVSLMSWQDTYYSANDNDENYRGYFEDCDLGGAIDWLCGSGNIWLERCNILVRDRSGNNLAAPAQTKEQQWGYVFHNCHIKPDVENPQKLKGKDWTLARPWNSGNGGKSPACTFLNTKMSTEPRLGGWGTMAANLVLRFHEYQTTDLNENDLSLGTRSLAACSPGAGSDDCVLNDNQAKKYSIREAMGGPDAFEPNMLCQQIDAASSKRVSSDTQNHETWNDNVELDDEILQWDAYDAALCYFVFKLDENGKWKYKTNTIATSVNLATYGSGYYCVRAANQRGGLGAPTMPIQYVLTDPYELKIKQVGNLVEDGKPYGWSTICLPFNAKVPNDEGLQVFAATPHNANSAQVDDYLMTLTPVTVIDSLKGYVVYGPEGSYSFKATSRSCDKPTILKGNPEYADIPAINKSCYVLSNKTWGVGFYKFVGSTLAANRAWLPQNMVSDHIQESLSTSTRAIRFDISSDATGIHFPILGVDAADGAVYNTQGQRVEKPTQPGIYIIKNKGKVVKK